MMANVGYSQKSVELGRNIRNPEDAFECVPTPEMQTFFMEASTEEFLKWREEVNAIYQKFRLNPTVETFLNQEIQPDQYKLPEVEQLYLLRDGFDKDSIPYSKINDFTTSIREVKIAFEQGVSDTTKFIYDGFDVLRHIESCAETYHVLKNTPAINYNLLYKYFAKILAIKRLYNETAGKVLKKYGYTVNEESIWTFYEFCKHQGGPEELEYICAWVQSYSKANKTMAVPKKMLKGLLARRNALFKGVYISIVKQIPGVEVIQTQSGFGGSRTIYPTTPLFIGFDGDNTIYNSLTRVPLGDYAPNATQLFDILGMLPKQEHNNDLLNFGGYPSQFEILLNYWIEDKQGLLPDGKHVYICDEEEVQIPATELTYPPVLEAEQVECAKVTDPFNCIEYICKALGLPHKVQYNDGVKTDILVYAPAISGTKEGYGGVKKVLINYLKFQIANYSELQFDRSGPLHGMD